MNWREEAKQALAGENRATTELTKPTKPAFVSSVSARPPVFSHKEGGDYTKADLAEMDRLLRELAKLESWPEGELADKLDQRRRMAPVNVIPALRWLRRVVAEPEPRKKRPFRLCKLEVVELAAIPGGKS